ALDWMVRNQRTLGIDTQRIAIMGHSAGGGLAAALAILARDRREYAIAGLVLVYPMLDHRTGSEGVPSKNESIGTIGWLPTPNQFCWKCMQGNYNLDDDRAGLFSPSMQVELAGLPSTFISVGALDLFLEEDVAYSLSLSRAGVAVELHVYPGAPHMFDQIPGRVTDQSSLDVMRALNRFLK
ncbi:alpha/beta hydrolase fold domain-containing protein, partial [Pseudomonas syringae]|nr:alpha/beta hydrolase fold domain-containing protein [Pseudomonas syringae]